MIEESSASALLTTEHVRQWVAERDELARQYADLHNKLTTVEAKLKALAQILPESVIAHLLTPSPVTTGNLVTSPASQHVRVAPPAPPAESRPVPVTDATVAVLADEKGGRTPGFVRGRLALDPTYAQRVKQSPNIVSNALSRLVERGLVVRDDGLYYHPQVHSAIRDGLIDEERQENGSSQTFNAVMHRVMSERGGKFTAADAIKAANSDERIAEGPTARIYSWLSREVFKNRLQKEGEFYFYPADEEEAQSVSSGASGAGGAPTPPTDSRPSSRDMFG